MTVDGPAPRPGVPPAPAVLVAAAVGGLAVMAVELSAVRLLAPYFGSSHSVWTNVIGVVLAALSLGYLLGARLAGGPRPAIHLGTLLAAGGVLVAWTPALARRVGAILVPEDLSLEDAAALVGVGSLAACIALFLVPATLLGAAGPLAVECVQRRRGGAAGTAGGFVLAASTVASLVGAFGTGHFALPYWGVARTFTVSAILLVAAGLFVLVLARGGIRTVVVSLALVSVLVPLARGDVDDAPRIGAGRRLLEVLESRYQRVIAVEEGEGDERLRFLQVNEALDSFQSVWRPALGLFGEGFYYDDFALPAHWAAAEGRDDGPWRTLVLGLGAGSVWRVLDGASPRGLAPEGLGAEIDPAVVDVATRWFDLDPADERWRALAGLDARVALRGAGGDFDLVAVDCYANQHELPPHLVTLEFFREVRAALGRGGFAVLNVGAFDLEDPLVAGVGGTLAAAFEAPVLALVVPRSRNVMLFARRDAPLPRPGTVEFVPREPALAHRAEQAALPGAWRRVEPAREPWTDDRAPVEVVQRDSLAHGRALRGGVEGAR